MSRYEITNRTNNRLGVANKQLAPRATQEFDVALFDHPKYREGLDTLMRNQLVSCVTVGNGAPDSPTPLVDAITEPGIAPKTSLTPEERAEMKAVVQAEADDPEGKITRLSSGPDGTVVNHELTEADVTSDEPVELGEGEVITPTPEELAEGKAIAEEIGADVAAVITERSSADGITRSGVKAVEVTEPDPPQPKPGGRAIGVDSNDGVVAEAAVGSSAPVLSVVESGEDLEEEDPEDTDDVDDEDFDDEE